MALLSQLTLSLLLALPAQAGEPEVPQSFAHLSHVEVAGSVHVWYDPGSTKVVGKVMEEEGPPLHEVLRFTCCNKPTEYTVVFSEGPSADPSFWFYQGEPTGQPFAQVAGTHLYLPGSGAVYVSGHTNNMYDHRRKFVLRGSQLVETEQPFGYVGLETKVSFSHPFFIETTPKLITLRSERRTDAPKVASLPDGAEIEVLLADDKGWVLIKSSFGLVGWYHMGEYPMFTPIGLHYAGD